MSGEKIKQGLQSKRNTAKYIAKKEIKKEKLEKKVASVLMLFTVVSLSILFLFLISQASILGYATYSVDTGAGSVTELTLYRKFPVTQWAGIYGLSLRVPGFTEQLQGDFSAGGISRQDLFFDCMEPNVVGGNEIYASASPTIDFDALKPVSISDIDSYIGCSGKIYCAANTFVEKSSIMVGTRKISDIPTAYTYVWDGNNTIFDTGLLTDGNNLVYVSHITDIQRAYSYDKLVNFQMMFPIPENLTTRLYFFTDPYDECPANAGVGDNVIATVYGVVKDSFGNPLENAEIFLAGVGMNSSLDGSYNFSFTVVPGEYNLFVKKQGYDDYFTNVTVNFSNFEIEKNISMNLFTPGLKEIASATVKGKVVDTNGVPILDASILFGNSMVFSYLDGSFELTASVAEGSNPVVGIKEGYNNDYKILNITTEGQVFDNITLVLEPADYKFDTGPYTEKPTTAVAQEIVEKIKARGDDYWVSTKEINKEVRQNTFIEENIDIYNLRKERMALSFALSPNLKDFVKIDKMASVLSPDTTSTLKVTIYGTKPIGSYDGMLTISGDLEQEIPIHIKVVEKKFSVEVLLMDINLFKNLVQPGDDLAYKLNLQNLLRDQNYKVDLVARIKDLKTDTIYSTENFSVEIKDSSSLLEKIPIPKNLTNGDYLLEVEAEYLNLYSTVTSSFVVSTPIYLYAFFGVPIWMMFLFISFFSFIFLNLYMYKRYRDRKKRYRTQVDYATLPKPGPRVVKLGIIAETNHPAYYEIDRMTTHGIVAGATGMGKSISAQVVIEEALMQGVCVMVFDPTAQWSGMLRKCVDKKMLAYYHKFGMKTKEARAFKGNVRMIKDFKQKLDVNKFLAPGQIQIFSMNKLTPAEIDIFVANTIKQIFRSDPKEAPELKIMFVFDEVHRLLPKFGGSGVGFLQIERACREFRKWGLGVMLISQVLNDFAGQIKANINTELQTRTLDEGDLERIKTKYGDDFLKSLVRAEVGVIMFQNADYNRGRPYFINFRPILHSTRRLSDEELEQYNKYNDTIDELEFQVEKLEEEKIDVFDLKMELKLIKDKIMAGNFSVVEIYLEGLVPRVAKEWKKLNKPAPKLKLELVDEKEMEEEEEKSKKEKAKLEKKKKEEPKDSENTKEIAKDDKKRATEENP